MSNIQANPAYTPQCALVRADYIFVHMQYEGVAVPLMQCPLRGWGGY